MTDSTPSKRTQHFLSPSCENNTADVEELCVLLFVMFMSYKLLLQRVIILLLHKEYCRFFEIPSSADTSLATPAAISFVRKLRLFPRKNVLELFMLSCSLCFPLCFTSEMKQLCQHLAVNLLSYPILYHSACRDPPHDPSLWGWQDTEMGILSLICLAWTSWWVKSARRRKSGSLCSRPSSLEKELTLTFIQRTEAVHMSSDIFCGV